MTASWRWRAAIGVRGEGAGGWGGGGERVGGGAPVRPQAGVAVQRRLWGGVAGFLGELGLGLARGGRNGCAAFRRGDRIRRRGGGGVRGGGWAGGGRVGDAGASRERHRGGESECSVARDVHSPGGWRCTN